jgi:adenosine kinase
LTDHDIDVSGIRIIPDEFTAGAYITTDMADNQITGFNPGAMKHPSNYRFPVLPGENATGALGIISPGNMDDMRAYSRRYKELNIPYIFDPGQQIPALKDLKNGALEELIEGAWMLISNDYELDLIQEATGFDTKALLDKTAVVITTLGEKGSVVMTRQGKSHVPAVKTKKVLDPTGAGDAYRSGLIKGLILQKDLVEAAGMGATCAGYAVEAYGTQAHWFDEKSFWKRYADNFSKIS